MRVVDLVADFRLRDRPTLRAVVRRPRRTRSSSATASTGCPSSTASEIAGADLVANPGCYPDRDAARARAARALGHDRRRRRRREVRRLGRRPRAEREDALRRDRRERRALRRRRAPPHARDRPGARGARRADHDHVHAAPHAAGPGRARLVLRHDDASRGARSASTRRTRDWADGLPFVEIVATAPGVRDVRDTNVCSICARADERTGKVFVFARDRQPLEGRGVAGRAEPQPHVRAARDAGDRAVSFFSSRWVPCPPHVADAGDEAACRRAFAPRPPQAASSRPACVDVGLLVCDAEEAVSAARFTRSGTCSRRRCSSPAIARALAALRVVVANSGNANAATGDAGIEVALAMQRAAAAATRHRPRSRRGLLDRRHRRRAGPRARRCPASSRPRARCTPAATWS